MEAEIEENGESTMSTETGFWRIVNRVNAAYFFALMICGTAALIMLVNLFLTDSRKRNSPKIAAPADSKVVASEKKEAQSKALEKDWTFGRSLRMRQSDYFRIPLQASSKSDSLVGYSSGSSRTVGNHLFVSAETGSSHWLFPSNDQLVLRADELNHSKMAPAAGMVYVVIRADTDGDGDLDNADQKEIGFSAADGTSYVLLIEDVEAIDQIHVESEHQVNLFFRKGGALHMARFSTTNLADLKVTRLADTQ